MGILAIAGWVLLAGYVLVGLTITAFCVHMSYHEAAIGVGDGDDAKGQRVLEGKFGLLGFLFLVLAWPLALAIAFFSCRPQSEKEPAQAEEAQPQIPSPTPKPPTPDNREMTPSP